MPFARTLRFEWKTILFLCAVGAGLIYIVFDLYRAWAFGVIHTPRILFGISHATRTHDPYIFRIAVALDVVTLLVMSLLLGFGIWSQWLQARGLRILETRPPVDDAIRESPDER
jgi:hypothetical protein